MDDEDIHKEELVPQSIYIKDNAGVRVMPPVIYMGVFLLAFILELAFGADLLPWSAQFSMGILLISLGVGLITWCIVLFIDEGTHVPPNQPTTKIVTVGPYSISRNPIYLGLSTLYLGATILLDMIWGLALFIPLIYTIQKYVIVKEETYLANKFKDEYNEYRDRVRRWL